MCLIVSLLACEHTAVDALKRDVVLTSHPAAPV